MGRAGSPRANICSEADAPSPCPRGASAPGAQPLGFTNTYRRNFRAGVAPPGPVVTWTAPKGRGRQGEPGALFSSEARVAKPGGKRTAAGMAAYKYAVCFGLLGGTCRVSMVAPDFAPESAAAAAAAPPRPHLAGQLPRRLARHPRRCTWLPRLHVRPVLRPSRPPTLVPLFLWVTSYLLPPLQPGGRRGIGKDRSHQGFCPRPKSALIPGPNLRAQAASGAETTPWVPRSPPRGAPGINQSQPRVCSRTTQGRALPRARTQRAVKFQL